MQQGGGAGASPDFDDVRSLDTTGEERVTRENVWFVLFALVVIEGCVCLIVNEFNKASTAFGRQLLKTAMLVVCC